jgi:hypothetical protein
MVMCPGVERIGVATGSESRTSVRRGVDDRSNDAQPASRHYVDDGWRDRRYLVVRAGLVSEIATVPPQVGS